ncbi:MAG: sensory box histidine kinase PhoR [Acidimicrobiales bacterium]
MSLRLRLLTGLAALVLLGLVGFGAGTYVSLHRFLVSRLDEQLSTAAAAVARSTASPGFPSGGHGGPDGDFGGIRANVGPTLFVELLDGHGTVLATVDPSDHTAGAPELPAESALLRAVHAGLSDRASFTVDQEGHAHIAPARIGPVRTISARSSVGGGERVALTAVPGSNATIVVAGSLHPVAQTLHRLLIVELGVGGGVLAITLVLGLALARQATRPLEEIARTADGIASGDLGRRVTATDPRSEVGRVGLAINAMLNEIQSAFARRDQTETRLRRFVADASHELSTPLTSIRGYAELFRRGLADRPDDLAKAMARIESEGARMGGLVDDLLLLASFDNGRPLQRDPVDLTRIATDTAADLRAAAPERPVTVEGDGAVIVVGDENRLRQVAANLASNARRHTPEGSPVTIRARTDGAFGVLEVADHGPGLAPDEAARVFDRFYRVDKARARAAGGAGLGLSIVATIAEALDGRASLDTSPDHGATFSVAIPLATAGSDG